MCLCVHWHNENKHRTMKKRARIKANLLKNQRFSPAALYEGVWYCFENSPRELNCRDDYHDSMKRTDRKLSSAARDQTPHHRTFAERMHRSSVSIRRTDKANARICLLCFSVRKCVAQVILNVKLHSSLVFFGQYNKFLNRPQDQTCCAIPSRF